MNKYCKVFFVVVFTLSNLFVFGQKSDLREYKLTLMGQNSNLIGNMVDLDKGNVYPVEEAGYSPKNIDFGYMYGTSTGGNLMAPVSQGFLTFGDRFKDALLLWGNDRNNATFINLGNESAAQEVFESIKSQESLDSLYTIWYDKIMAYPDYNPGKHGPGQRTRPIAFGDVIFFRSENKDRQHVFRIVKYEQSNRGTLELQVKSPTKSKKKKK